MICMIEDEILTWEKIEADYDNYEGTKILKSYCTGGGKNRWRIHCNRIQYILELDSYH